MDYTVARSAGDLNGEVIGVKHFKLKKILFKYDKNTNTVIETKNDVSTVASSEYYVTWGWFEDNVLNRFFSNITKTSKKIIGEIRSIDPVLDENGKIKKNADGDIIYEYIKFTDGQYLITTDANKWIIPKSTDPVFGKFIHTLINAEIKDVKTSNGIIGGDGVEIRKIYFNARYLQNKLSDMSDLKNTVDTIWSDFSSEYGGIYKFNLDIDNENNRLVVREEGYINKNLKVDKDDKKNKVFIFPTWEAGSIVKSQTINAKLPDRMKIAAMYGSSQIESDEPDEDYTSIASRAWGKLAKPKKPESTGSNYELTIQRFEDNLDGEIDIPYRNNRPFGMVDADIQSPIFIGEIWDELNKGTVIHKSVKDIVTKRGKQRFAQDVTEKVEDPDVKTIAQHKMVQEKYATHLVKAFGVLLNNDNQIPDWDVFYTISTESAPKLRAPALFKIQQNIRREIGSIIHPLIPIEFELEIDGTGGMFPGNSFHSSYLSQMYKEEALFQMVGVGHKIDSSGWTTSIKGQIRAKPINNIKDKKLAEEKSKQLLKNQDKAQEKALIMGEAGYKLPPGLVTWAENRQNEPFSIIYKGEKSFVDDSGKLTFTVDGAPLDTDAMSSSGLDDMIPSTFGSGTNYFGSISQMAKELGVEQSVIEDNLKSRYNWNGVAKNVQAGWTFPR